MPSTIFNIVSWFLSSLGIALILKKCGQRGWYAFIPGLRYYRLGIACGREPDALKCLVLEIVMQLLSVCSRFVGSDETQGRFLLLLQLFFGIILVVFEIRVLVGICQIFGLRRRWIFFWILLPSFAPLVLGCRKKYQPVHIASVPDDEYVGGLAPAELSAAVDADESDDGLVVHVRARTAKNFGKTRYLLKDINLTVPNGSLVLLLGGSGAGKTTLVNAVTGYEKADADVRLNGKDIYNNYDEMKYRIGFAPQQDLLRMNDTVTKTLNDAALLRLPAGVSAKERRAKIESVMDTLGLSGRQDGLVAKKSGGQKKRISIGMELISDPDLFILDEPDSGLDGVIARELFERLRAVADEGKIVIAITHTPDRVADLFDKVIVLARDSGKVGRLAFYGSPEEAKAFFSKDSMESIVMAINSRSEGGEGRADEFIEKYAQLTMEKEAVCHG